MSNMNQTTRLVFPCYVYNWLLTGSDNHTILRSPGNFYANFVASYLKEDFEVVFATSEPDPNITTLPELQTMYDGKADLCFDTYYYRQDRNKFVDFLFPVKV